MLQVEPNVTMVYPPGTKPQRLQDLTRYRTPSRTASSTDNLIGEESSNIKDIKSKGPVTTDTIKRETTDFCAGVSEHEFDDEVGDKSESSWESNTDTAGATTSGFTVEKLDKPPQAPIIYSGVTVRDQLQAIKAEKLEETPATYSGVAIGGKTQETQLIYSGVSVGGKTHAIEDDGTRPPFICKICDRTLSSKVALRVHMEKKHSAEKPFKCGVCAKGFIGRYMMRRHKVATHMRRCDNCQTYVSEVDPWTEPGTTVKSHRHVVCGQCQNIVVFTSSTKGETREIQLSNDLEELQKVHKVQIDEKDLIPEEENFEAVQYIADSSIKPPVRRAQRKNQGGYCRYACCVCKKLFSDGHEVLKHQMTHYTERQFMCDICGHTVKSSLGLNHHKKLHTEIKIFPCKLCSKRYRNKTGVIDHMGRVHNVYDMKNADVECSDIYNVDSGTIQNVKITDNQLVVDGEVILNSSPSTSMI